MRLNFIIFKIILSVLVIVCFYNPGLKAEEGMKTELKMYDGRPTLFINGKPHDGLFCSVRSPYMKNFIDAGFDIFDTHPTAPNGWIGDGKYDYSKTDAYIEAYLKQKPDAKLIIRFWFGYPRNFWWAVKHKDQQAVSKVRDKGRKMPSYASLKWREEAGEALRRVIAHCEKKYGDNIIAYVPGGGSCGEWFQWYAYTEDPDRLTKGYEMGDYSKPMREAFQKFVKEKYKNLDTVNRVYESKLSNWNELKMTEPKERLSSKLGNLRDISKEQAVLDYYEVLNLQVAETLLYFAKKAKEGCDHKKVVMFFYGYHWLEQPRGGVTLSRSGHVHLDEVLSSPDVDYIVAPYHYSFRQLGGVMSGQGLPSSVIHRNKQYVQEIDCSTYLKPSWPCEDHDVPANPWESEQILRRDLSKTMMEGASLWYMDLFKEMYDSPEMIKALKRTLQIGRENYFKAGKNNRQVAVILSSKDSYYYRENEPLRALLLPQFKQFELERMGLGYDDLMLENLKYLSTEETSQYKFWIFPSAVSLNDNEIALIKKHCLRNGNYVLWVYAPDILSRNGLDLKKMENLTGFQCGYTLEPGELAVLVKPGDSPLTHGRKSPIVYGTYGETGPDLIKYHSSLRHFPGSDTGFKISPRFFIKNGDVNLGKMLDLKDQPAGLAVKDMGKWTSILSTAPMVPKFILRNIAREAGCHVFTEFPGQTYQSDGYVGFFAHDAGNAVFHLPFKAIVEDVFKKKILFKNVQKFTLRVKLNQAVLFRYTKVTGK